MLQGINRIGKSWAGRVIVAVMFGFLIVSFAVWGIGDIFRGNVRTQVATVGGIDISAEAFRNAYQTEYQSLIRRLRQTITPDQARAFGLDQRVLSRLVTEAAFDAETRRLGLQVPDPLVLRSIQEDPSFRGPDGRFDPRLFADMVRQLGMSEAQFVREQRAVVARQQFAEGMTGASRAPLALREAIHRYGAERRSVEFVRLTPAMLGEAPAPTDPQVQTFYDERKADYRAPEYRVLTLLPLDAATLAKPDGVTDDEARAYYARIKDTRFGNPERRTVEQISFPTLADADAAAARIRSGASFEDLAKERGLGGPALELGTFARGEMVDPATAEAAFGLPQGEVSAPVTGRFGPVLIRVTKIEPATLKPFEEVAPEIRREIALARARDEVQKVHDAIEEQRASGRPLGEIARERGLPTVGAAAVDRSGLDKSGQAIPGLPGGPAMLASAFRSDVGADTDAVPTADGGYVWFEVTGVEPSRDRPLAEVRDRVAADWAKEEGARGLAERARLAVERIDKGETVAAVAGDARPETATDFARTGQAGALPATVVARVFATPVGKAASASDGADRIVFKITAATVPPFVTTTQESIAADGQARSLVSEEVLAESIAEVEKRVGVTLYPENIRRAIGGET